MSGKVNPLEKSNIPPPMMVEWEDSAQAVPGWQWLEDVETPAVNLCWSIGFVVRRTDQLICLAISRSAETGPTAQVAGVITIPMNSVRRIYTFSGAVWEHST